ncbi:hypothetical protein DM860_003513 [Cuscuta australis]|uniref:Uncharacterized protein n=1 Tax=Cuscuta australis TaxID=267555 RepID=A0A328DGT9_9ASTE|nr:hypothetical protein DM860_003513 [Cuscuta australis]
MASKMILCRCLMVILGIIIQTYCPVSSRPLARRDADNSTSSLRAIFRDWMTLHGKSYPLASDEYEMRFQIFKENVNYIEALNAKPGRSYKLGINEFTDLTHNEFTAIYASGLKSVDITKPKRFPASASEKRFRHESKTASPLPNRVSWKTNGAVTAAKNQGNCGSCWVFSAVAAVEALNFIKTGKLKTLSEQEFMDCAVPFNVDPCTGYDLRKVFDAITKVGIANETDYPYTAVRGNCKLPLPVAATIDGYDDSYPRNDEIALQEYVATRPVSVSINGAAEGFQHYKSGVFSSGDCHGRVETNHAVLLIGYGTDPDTGVDYWKIKNSWGLGWGMAGIGMIQRGGCGPQGHLGIASEGLYPI